MNQLRHASFAAAFALTSAFLSNPALAGVRAFVSSTGNDANTASQCGPTTPCRSFTAAMGIVDPNGEIIALDAAGYGAVTVTKSVTITANPGFYAGVAASSGVAITIATAGVNVVLRGLNINNIGTATTGVDMTNGARLVIENCVISNFGNYGVSVSTPAEVRIADSSVRESQVGVAVSNGATATVFRSRFAGSNSGIWADGSSAATTTTLAVSDSSFSGNHIGVYACAYAGATTRVAISRSTLSNNSWGYAQDPCGGTQVAVASNNLITGNDQYGLANFSGTLQSTGTNTGGQNGGNSFGAITAVSAF